MINSFSQYLIEEERVVYFTFGRMNPPTIGHGKLLDKIAASSGRNPYRVYLSQSSDPKKNPLSYSDKVKHVRKMFPKHARSVMVNKKVKTAIDAAVALYDEGFRKIVMVVGSDRVREFDILLNKYNGKQARHGFYNYKTINVISAGARDPDADGVEGMSASKQRDNAAKNDFTTFAQGTPKGMSNNDARRLFNDVRKGMGLKEQKDFKRHIQLDSVSETREKFIEGALFELGEQVIIKKTDEVGTITVLGSNYVIVETTDRKTRQWLDAVEKIEEKTLTKNELKKRKEVADAIKRDNPGMPMDKKMAIATSVAKRTVEDRWYKQQPEWGTPESTKKAKSTTPGEIGELSMSLKDLTKSGINKKGVGNKDKLKKDLEKLKKGLNKEDAMDIAKAKIDREKIADTRRHDRILDRARLAVARKKNAETKPNPSNRETRK